MSVRRITIVLIGLVCLALTPFGSNAISARRAAPLTRFVYLPMVMRFEVMPFGIETSSGWIANAAVNNRAQQLGVKWIRMNAIRWRAIQPNRGGPYNVAALAKFERDLQAARAGRLIPVVIVIDSPAWATINQPFPTSCGAIRSDRFADFAVFMGWLAARYKDSVRYWEIGNEPDVDPKLVLVNQVYGCWGNISDPYYGGERYGAMLKVVTPAIKHANPQAQVVIGGLMLTRPNTTAPNLGKPEKFFEGILRAGAANSFDIVAYHSYPAYTNQPLDYDYDLDMHSQWASLGGYTIGKAKFLRSVMAKFPGVNKPLFLNETGLTCPIPPNGSCAGAGPTFFQAQADYVIRMLTRGWSIGVQQITWYTLQGPGWDNSGLLDAQQRPRPVYLAYQQFIAQTNPSDPPTRIHDYDRSDVSIESYRFNKGIILIDILWAKDLSTYYVKLPPRFTKAYNQYGAEVRPIGPYLPVSFSPIYIQHQR
jgi:hypothetical protein